MLVPPANFGIAEEGIYRCSKVETLNLSFLEALDLKTVLFIGGQEPSMFFKEFFNRSSINWISIKIADYSNVAVPVNSLSNSQVVASQEEISNPDIENGISSDSSQNITKTNKRTDSKHDNIADKNMNADGNNDNDNNYLRIKSTPKNKHLKYVLNDSDELMLIKSSCLKKTFKVLLDHNNYNILLVDKSALIIGILRKIEKWNISSVINEYRLYTGKNRSYFAETFLELIQIEVEQEKIENVSLDRKEALSLDQGMTIETQRKMSNSNIVLITEDDLCNPPEVPKRLIKIIEDAERRENLDHNDMGTEENLLARELQRSSSNLGIFGHRYRLAFNKKENGDYGYYKCGNNERQHSDAVRLKIPNELKLPEWFKFRRDLWEQDNVPEVHHFYKEQIFV